jgi:hypothetical protein
LLVFLVGASGDDEGKERVELWEELREVGRG